MKKKNIRLKRGAVPRESAAAAAVALPAVQQRSNCASEGYWDLYADHRKRLMDLLTASQRGGTLCVIGAGNTNDLDLPILAEHYAEVHLVDVDRQAVERGVARQLPRTSSGVRIHAPFDITGAFAALAGCPPVAREVVKRIQASANEWRKLGQHDVVVSDCVLTQVFLNLLNVLERRPARDDLHEIARAVQKAHLGLLVQMARPGGSALLITELTSSDDLPLLDAFQRHEPERLMIELVRASHCYLVANPATLLQLVDEDPALAPLVDDGDVETPWLWTALPNRVYLVTALRLSVVAPSTAPA